MVTRQPDTSDRFSAAVMQTIGIIMVMTIILVSCQPRPGYVRDGEKIEHLFDTPTQAENRNRINWWQRIPTGRRSINNPPTPNAIMIDVSEEKIDRIASENRQLLQDYHATYKRAMSGKRRPVKSRRKAPDDPIGAIIAGLQ